MPLLWLLGAKVLLHALDEMLAVISDPPSSCQYLRSFHLLLQKWMESDLLAAKAAWAQILAEHLLDTRLLEE